MPFCTSCGAQFNGRGTYCRLHSYYHSNPNQTSSRVHDQINRSSDAVNARSILYRTDSNHWRPRTLRFADKHDTYEHCDDDNAVVHYKTNQNVHHPNLTSFALNQPLVQVFSALTDAHSIASVNYSVNHLTGTHSLVAEANLDREQCAICQRWFADREKLRYHHKDFSLGCEEYGVCLSPEDIWWHGQSVRHERCFVRGCSSIYRREAGWKAEVVERHIRNGHC